MEFPEESGSRVPGYHWVRNTVQTYPNGQRLTQMCTVAIFGEICIQSNSMLTQQVKLSGQSIELGMDVFEVFI